MSALLRLLAKPENSAAGKVHTLLPAFLYFMKQTLLHWDPQCKCKEAGMPQAIFHPK